MFLDQFLILSRPKEMIGLQTILGTLNIMHCLACGCLEKPYRALRSTIKNCSMINSATMNIGVHVSLSDLVSLVCMPRSGIAGSYGSSISSF